MFELKTVRYHVVCLLIRRTSVIVLLHVSVANNAQNTQLV